MSAEEWLEICTLLVITGGLMLLLFGVPLGVLIWNIKTSDFVITVLTVLTMLGGLMTCVFGFAGFFLDAAVTGG